MKKFIVDIDKFHETRKGKFSFAAVELALAYILGARAIDTGSIWQYALAAFLFIGGFNNLIRAIATQKVAHAKNKRR